jgi:uncharacterized membrane protein
MSGWIPYLTLALAIGSALIAGAFFAFSAFVMRALGHLPENQGITAMQRINIDVINPWFMIPFTGTAVVGLAGGTWAALNLSQPAGPWLLAASLLYVLGCFGVTMVFNVPRNNMLAIVNAERPQDAFVLPSNEPFWSNFQREWTRWNTFRTLASLAAMICTFVAYRLLA